MLTLNGIERMLSLLDCSGSSVNNNVRDILDGLSTKDWLHSVEVMGVW